MDTGWLEDFLSLAETRSFSRSADQRHITQPAFSRRIRALERWVGAGLVDRATYPVTLTGEGVQFRHTAQEILARLYRERDEFRANERRDQDTISFAALHTLALSFFPHWMTTLVPRVVRLKTRLIADDVHGCVASLVEGDCDFLLCFAHPAVPILLDPAQFPSIKLAVDRLIPVCARDAAGEPRFRLTAGAEPEIGRAHV